MPKPYRKDCQTCRNKCDGISKANYNFINDVEFSEHYEQLLISAIINNGYFACKTDKDGYPDIEIYDKEQGDLLCYLEVKAQQRTFMSVGKILPSAALVPSETLALNLSDLERYIKLDSQISTPIYLMWVLSNRPCIVTNKTACFYNNVKELAALYQHYGDKRRFRRKSGEGDVVNGQHKGVVVNYHFSINELKAFTSKTFPDAELS